jgi:signal peptidase I
MKSRVVPVVLAGVANAFVPPLGYFYAGAWRVGIGVAALIVGSGVLAFQLTVQNPPGFYGLGPRSFLIGQLVLMLVTGLHAAWLRARRTPRQSLIVRLVCGAATVLGLAAFVFAFRAYWPASTYRIASTQTEPSLHSGDIVAVRGARAICGGPPPVRGDFVVVANPQSGGRGVRRVAAGPTDTITTNEGILTAAPATWLIADSEAPAGYQPVHAGELCGVVYRIIQSSEARRIGTRPRWAPLN